MLASYSHFNDVTGSYETALVDIDEETSVQRFLEWCVTTQAGFSGPGTDWHFPELRCLNQKDGTWLISAKARNQYDFNNVRSVVAEVRKVIDLT